MKPELSDMLSDAKSDAPSPRYSVDDFVNAGRKRQRRVRSMYVGTGAAAAVLAVSGAIAIPQLLPGGNDDNSATTTQVAAPSQQAAKKPFAYPESDFTANFKPFRAGELSVSAATVVTPGYESASITAPGKGQIWEDADGTKRDVGNQVASLTVYKSGVFDPSEVRKGDKTGDAFYSAGVAVDPKDKKTPTSGEEGTYAWEYADNSWAVITFPGEKLSAGKLAKVAEGLSAAEAAPVKIGFELGYVPAGFKLTSAGTTYHPGAIPLQGASYALLLKGDLGFTGLKTPIQDPYVVGEEQLPLLQLQTVPVWANKYPAKGDEPYCATEGICYIKAPGGKYVLEAWNGGGLSDGELKKVLSQVKFATANDKSTWFAATDATS